MNLRVPPDPCPLTTEDLTVIPLSARTSGLVEIILVSRKAHSSRTVSIVRSTVLVSGNLMESLIDQTSNFT